MTRRARADEHLEFYDKEFGKEVMEAEVDLLLEHLPEEGRVLSLGCGIGVHEEELIRRRPGLDLVCSDLQDEMLVEVPDHMARVGANMMALPFSDESFDAVYEITALVFVPDPERALAEMVRVLKPGGLLLLFTLNPVSRWGLDRLQQLPAPWGTLEGLVAMMDAATGGTVTVDHALNLEEEDILKESTGLEDAALLILVSLKASDKS